MIPARKAATVAMLCVSTAALASDQAPLFQPGEWQFELSQEGGATYKDGKSEREDGTSSVSTETPTQTGKRCITKEQAKLDPALFAPGCSATQVTYTATTMKAELTCGNPAMPMTGNVSMTITDDGTKISGFQFLSGGGTQVGAVMMSRIKMTHLGDCKGQ